MNKQILKETATALLAGSKSLLAMDESNNTCNKRFGALGIPQREEARRSFREWIITTPGLNESISGAILFDETIRQQTANGIPFREVLEKAGIIPGIKVDSNVTKVLKSLYRRAKLNATGRRGKYDVSMEKII